MIRRLRPLWGEHGAGMVWLAFAIGATFVFGLMLQLIALRALSRGDYATFVFALGIGNIANAIAAAVQPVTAVRVAEGDEDVLPLAPNIIVGAAAAGTLLGAGALGASVGPAIALLAVSQIPLHAAVGLGLGRLQGSTSFFHMALTLTIWSILRVAVVAPVVVTGGDAVLVFVLALPAALGLEIGLLAALGAYRGLSWRRARDGRRLLAEYGLWALFAWLLNADAIYARLILPETAADEYALAFTLGRQSLYAVAPLAIVLLPATIAASPETQRRRMYAIFLASGGLLVATFAVIGVRPEALVDLLSGETRSVDAALIRGYAVIGALTAAVTLQLTFAFALGRPPRLRVLLVMGVGSALTAAFGVTGSGSLLLLQAAVVVAILVYLTALGFDATMSGKAAAGSRQSPVRPGAIHRRTAGTG